MTGRRWSEVKAEAMARQPWLAGAEASMAMRWRADPGRTRRPGLPPCGSGMERPDRGDQPELG
jgi:hypothetical protein